MSLHYTVGWSTPAHHTCFVALLSFLEIHTFLSACQVPLADPILLFTSLSDPSCVLDVPTPRYTKFSTCSNSSPSTSRRNFLFPSPRNRHSVFCMFIFIPIFWLTCVTPVSFCNSFSCSASRAMSSANLKSLHL